MKGNEIIVKGAEHLKYYIAEYGDIVNICYKEGPAKYRDKGNYFIPKDVFELNYDAENNCIDPNNMKYPEPTIAEINEQIQAKREQAYKDRSDSLYMAWQKYLALGESVKAEQAKALWLAEVEKINEEFPYKE